MRRAIRVVVVTTCAALIVLGALGWWRIGRRSAAAASLGVSQTFMDYKILPYRVIALNGDTLYGCDMSTYEIHKSIDGGNTWTEPLAKLPAPADVGALTDSGKLVVFTTNNQMFYSGDNGKTFQLSMSHVYRPLQDGIDINGDTIVFGEYTTQAPVTLNVYRSTDGGLTWHSVLEQRAPSQIRHFHTVKYFSEYKLWYLTSGDTDAQTQWWTSSHDGASWTNVAGGAAVPWRTVGVTNTAPRTIIWASDHDQDTFIYAARKGLESKSYRRIGMLPGHALGVAGSKDFLVAAARVEATDPKGSLFDPVYVSPDSGRTWFREGGMTAKVVGSGFEGIRGPDKWGQFYLQYYKIEENSAPFVTVRATPRKDVSYPGTPFDYRTVEAPFTTDLLNEAVRDAVPRVISLDQTLTESDLYQPQVTVHNGLNRSVEILVLLDKETLTHLSGNAPSVTIPAGATVVVQGTDLHIGQILPMSAILQVQPVGVPTSGSLRLEVSGVQYEVDDFRLWK